MAKLFITKGKILKDYALISFIKTNAEADEIIECDEKHTATPHPKLKSAFQSLALHAAALGEFIEDQGTLASDANIQKLFYVTGFTIKGGEQMQGVTLSARKILTNGKHMGFNTPLTMFKDEGEQAYPHLTELLSCVKMCQKEIMLYLDGKHGKPDQPKIDFPPQKAQDEESIIEGEIVEGAKPKQRTRKKKA